MTTKKNNIDEDKASFLGDMKGDSPLRPYLTGNIQSKVVPYAPLQNVINNSNREKDIRKNIVSAFLFIATVLLITIMLV